jgi:hypothetical protein
MAELRGENRWTPVVADMSMSNLRRCLADASIESLLRATAVVLQVSALTAILVLFGGAQMASADIELPDRLRRFDAGMLRQLRADPAWSWAQTLAEPASTDATPTPTRTQTALRRVPTAVDNRGVPRECIRQTSCRRLAARSAVRRARVANRPGPAQRVRLWLASSAFFVERAGAPAGEGDRIDASTGELLEAARQWAPAEVGRRRVTSSTGL